MKGLRVQPCEWARFRAICRERGYTAAGAFSALLDLYAASDARGILIVDSQDQSRSSLRGP